MTDDQAEDVDDGLDYGDFVRVDVVARTVEEGQLVDTTDPEVAEDEGIEEGTFEPRTIVLGEGHLFDPVEEDMIGKEAGEEGEIVVSHEDAFGEHDPDQVRTVSADKIPEDDRYPGAHVHVDGDHGHVEAIIGGRARVNFNHPLAGDDIEYEYEILEIVDDRIEQAQGLLQTYVDQQLDVEIKTIEEEEEQLVEADDEDANADDEAADDEEADDEDEPKPEYETVTVEKEVCYIEATPQLNMDQQWMMGKSQIANEIIDKVGLDRVVVQETFDGAPAMGGGMPGMMDGLEDIEDVDAEELAEEIEAIEE